MIKHEEVWRLIDALAKKHGMSASGLAKKSGLDSTSFNKSKRTGSDGKARWPSTESISKILRATNETYTSFFETAGLMAQGGAKEDHYLPFFRDQEFQENDFLNQSALPNKTKCDAMWFPAFPADKESLFAMEITNDSYRPVYRPGTILILCTDLKRIRRGDRVLVKTNTEILIQEFLRRTAHQLELESWDSKPQSLPLNDVLCLWQILWASQ